MLFGVALAGSVGMLLGILGVRGGRMGVVGSLFVVASFLVLGGFGVVFGSLGVVGGGLLVAICCFLRHGVEIKETDHRWPAFFAYGLYLFALFKKSFFFFIIPSLSAYKLIQTLIT